MKTSRLGPSTIAGLALTMATLPAFSEPQALGDRSADGSKANQVFFRKNGTAHILSLGTLSILLAAALTYKVDKESPLI